MSIMVVPFDDTLSAQFRDRVTHYLNCRVAGTGCGDVFSPVSYSLRPVFSAELLEGIRQAGEALQKAPFMPVMVEVSTDVKMLLDSELFFLIFGPQMLYGSAGLSPGQAEKYRILLNLRFPDEGDCDCPESFACSEVHRSLTDWCAFQDAVMRKQSANLARGRLLSQVLNRQRQRRDFPDTAWGALMLQMLPADKRIAVDQLSLVVPELMRLFRAGLKRVTEGEMALVRGCSLKTLHEYPLLRVLTDGVFTDDTGILMQYRSDWLSAASVWLRDIIPLCGGGRVPSAVTEAVRSAVLAMAFDDFHALVHATAYDRAVSMPAHDGDDLQSVSPMRLLLGGGKDE
ncbi:hypothetical protein M6F62_002349 [Salmonella enterica]|nr:hypothetical protein [Salmonella enterica]EJB0472575.1 hypothetical protein [Salmonella enterica]EJC1142995.1 hypothetical protein [Salmonella enterica]EJC1509917.1 hypothetical protein [Salmonella enterica]EJC3420686.1 hypothetical protein [Salmonella enterica]